MSLGSALVTSRIAWLQSVRDHLVTIWGCHPPRLALAAGGTGHGVKRLTMSTTSLAGDNVSVVEWDSSGGSPCSPTSQIVLTFRYLGDAVDNGAGDTTGDDLQAHDEPFAFVVP